MNHKELLKQVHDKLFAVYGVCECPLLHESPFQLLAAVMLSAQCRDERVNQVTRQLFAIAPDAKKISEMNIQDIEKIIHPCGLSGSKSRHLQAAGRMITDHFNGDVPRTMDELILLPGIGRKSANVILGNCFNIPGFPVDTHVRRVLNRLGAVCSASPEKIEKTVTSVVDAELWTNFSHLLIQHGRKVCHAGKPKCENCILSDICQKKVVKK